jgi:hypothetical protein
MKTNPIIDDDGANCRWWEIAIAALCFVCVPVFGAWWERRRALACVAVIVALLWGAVAAFGEPQVTIKSDGSRTFVTVTSTNHVAYVLFSSFDLAHWHELATVHRPAPRMTIELFPTPQRMFFKVETLAHEH